MPKCSRCQTTVSVWSFDLASALCPNCKKAAAHEAAREAKRAADTQRLEQVKRAIEPRAAPETEPVSGPTLIVISLVIAAVGGFLTASPDARVVGLVIVGIAGMVYLAGVIRWGVTGAQLTQLDRLERQNAEIIAAATRRRGLTRCWSGPRRRYTSLAAERRTGATDIGRPTA
jgi:hypothetical protein